MVYRGKPSNFCQRCRERRIKCDMLKPACSTCLRASQPCSGYRDVNTTRFVDETVGVVRRYSATSDPARAFDESLDEVALASFRHHHALEGHENVVCTSVTTPCLTAAMQCLGLATQATLRRNAKYSQGARRYYVLSLQEVSAALQTEVTVTNDEVLLSIIMLSCFEAITGTNGKSVAAWSRHVRGTAALIDKRGTEQLATAEGRLLFMQASTCLIPACIRGHVRMPDCIQRLWGCFLTSVDQPENAVYRVHGACLSVVDVCHDFCHSIGEANAIIDRCLDLDQKLANAFEDCDETWQYSSASVSTPTLSDSSRTSDTKPQHVYHDPMAVQLWNSMRSCRLILYDIMQQALRIDAGTSQRLGDFTTQGITSSMQQVGADIIASAPYFLALPATTRTRQRLELTPQLPLYSSRLPLLHTTQGYNWTWHLGLVARFPAIPREAQRLACSYMKQIGTKCGVQQAIYLASTLEESAPLVQ
ncbi:hypothetical protein LTR95_017704 [Oleoguttula sp. CCFEE 5521]